MKKLNHLITIAQAYRELTHIRHFKKALSQPRAAQEKKLLEIVRLNQESAFGKKFGFAGIKSIKDYQAQVPPCTYEDLAPYIENSMNGIPRQLSVEAPLMYATTSGTTGSPKFIPVTRTHLRDYTHAFHVHNWGLIRDNLAAAHAPGSSYLIFSSNDVDGHTKDGTPYGSVSGLLRARQSFLVQRYFALPLCVSRIKDVESKYYSILRLALCRKIVCITSCNPSTLLILADQLQEHAESLIKDIFDGSLNSNYRPPEPLYAQLSGALRPDRDRARKLVAILEKDGLLQPPAVWPDLSVVSVWKGGPMQFYLQKLPEKYGPVKIRDLGYMASEGRGTIPLSDEGAGGVAALTSHFFEFVPEEDEGKSNCRFLTLDELSERGRYYIHFTTSAGLYRYDINDLMEVVGFESQTPILQFVQKGKGISSLTGEKLTEEQVSAALALLARENQSVGIDHFILAPVLAEKPFYRGFIETTPALSLTEANDVAARLDQSLQHLNIEYKDKRRSLRLAALELRAVKRGTFMKLRQMRVWQGSPEAQVKIPFLTNNNSFCRDIATLSDAELNPDLTRQA